MPDRIRSENQEEAFEEYCRPHVHNRQTRPVQRLLGEPVQLVLRARGGLGNAHLRHRHLRHVHEGLDAVVARHRSGVDRGFEISCRDRHAEIDARHPFDRLVHRGKIGQVALHDLGTEPPQTFRAFILPPNQGAHPVSPVEQHGGEVAAHRADVAGRAGDEDGSICHCHGEEVPLSTLSGTSQYQQTQHMVRSGTMSSPRP